MTRTYRKPYTKSKRFDTSCRNHGSCGYCKVTRTHPDSVRARIAAEKFNDWYDGNYLEDWEVKLMKKEAEESLAYLAELEELEDAAAESIARLDKPEEKADNSD